MANGWCERRDELEPGMVFLARDGDVLRLDRRVPGDGTQWYADAWSWNGAWSSDDRRIEPDDLAMELPSDYAGEDVSHLVVPEEGGYGQP